MTLRRNYRGAAGKKKNIGGCPLHEDIVEKM
jgi:hypothetical protein